MSEKLPAREYDEHGQERSYGFFGYSGFCIDFAIRSDSIPMINECIEQGFLNEKCKTLDGCAIAKHAERRGSKRVAGHLVSIGYPA